MLIYHERRHGGGGEDGKEALQRTTPINVLDKLHTLKEHTPKYSLKLLVPVCVTAGGIKQLSRVYVFVRKRNET